MLQNYTSASDIGHAHGNTHTDTHTHEDNGFMVGLNLGYASIEAKDTHMQDDSGEYLGIHIMKHLESERYGDKLAWAAGAHKIFTKEPHLSAMIGLMYSLTEDLTLSVMPSVMWMKHANHSESMGGMGGMGGMGSMGSMGSMMTPEKAQWQSEYATHIEISYKVQIKDLLLNPSISCMTSSSHASFMFGLNFKL